MKLLRVVGSLDPAEGGLSQAIRSSADALAKLGINTEVVCCDSPEAEWLGTDSFPVHATGPRKYGFAYAPKLESWLEANLRRFDAVVIDGLWLWPSVCATRAVARERRRRLKDQEAKRLRGEEAEQRIFSHGLTRIDEDKSERLAADRTRGNAASSVTRAGGKLSADGLANSSLATRHPSLFVMPHGMLDPWFQRDKSRRVKAVRNWFYWWLVERGVVNSADALLFTCQQEPELARTTFGGYRPKKEIVVGLGIEEPPAFEPKMRDAFAEKCPGLNAQSYLLFMSRIHAKKGVDLLLRAYARVRSEHNKGIFSHSRATRDSVRPAGAGRGQIDKEPCEDFSHGLTRIDADESERLAADRTAGNASCQVIAYGPSTASRPPVPAVGSQSRQPGKEHDAFPDLVVAGPGWESDYGREVRGLIDEANRSIASTANCQLATANSSPIHAVGMLAGDSKWGALYGCEAFVLPSHQENFGIAVAEALACGKPVLISDQVNIWREIVEDGAGIAETDTEEGVVKLLRKFLNARRDEGGDLRPEVRTKPRACYLKRFAIAPAAAKLAEVLSADNRNRED